MLLCRSPPALPLPEGPPSVSQVPVSVFSAGDPAAGDLKLRTLGPLFCLGKLAYLPGFEVGTACARQSAATLSFCPATLKLMLRSAPRKLRKTCVASGDSGIYANVSLRSSQNGL